MGTAKLFWHTHNEILKDFRINLENKWKINLIINLKNQIIEYISKIYWHYNRKFDYDDALRTVKHNAL